MNIAGIEHPPVFIDSKLHHAVPNIPHYGTCGCSENVKMRAFWAKMASFWPKRGQKTGFAVTNSLTY
jgi:hypothetical protein